MDSFLEIIVDLFYIFVGMTIITAVIVGGLGLLFGIDLSFWNTLSVMFLILLGLELIADTLNAVKKIALISGLWLMTKFLNSIPINVLAMALVAFLVYVCIKAPPPPPVREKWLEDIEKGLDEMSLARKEEKRDNLQREIEDLERERDSIPTYNGIIFGGSGISESKLEYNRRRRDELDEEIRDKEWKLKDLIREIEAKKRELED